MKNIWTEKQKKIMRAIIDMATDKRKRVLWEDEAKWLEEKMKEIKRLAKKLPYIKWEGKRIS